MAWVSQATDNFTRDNESPLAGNWGAWASAAGNRWNLTSNAASAAAHLDTDMAAGWNARTWARDHASKCQGLVLTGTGAGTGAGPCVRLVEGTHTAGYYLYRLIVNAGASNNAQIDRASNGSWTGDIAHWTVAHADGDTYELRVEGLGAATHLTVLHNDAEVGTYDDASGLSDIGIPGIAYSSTMTAAVLDDWVGYETQQSSVSNIAFLSGVGW